MRNEKYKTIIHAINVLRVIIKHNIYFEMDYTIVLVNEHNNYY